MSTECRIQFPLLYPEQERVLSSESRFNVVSGAEYSGKSTMAIDVLLTSKFGALNGYPVGFFLPDQEALLAAKRRVLALIEPLLTGRLDGNHINLKNGGVIHFYAIDTDVKKIWEQISLAVVDDASLIGGIYEIWEDVIEPALQRYRGFAWIFGKPKGLRSSFGRLFALQDQDSRWEGFILPTAANEAYPEDWIERDRGTMHKDLFRQERLGEFIDTQIELTAAQSIIGRDETFRQWCERLANDGLRVDGKLFRLDNRPAMAWIYDQIPTTEDEAYRYILVIMKCAQVGFTVMEILAALYLGIKFGPCTLGMFLPDMNLAGIKSTERFMPIVRSIPKVHALMTQDAADGSGRKAGEGNVTKRRLNNALYVFSWTSGRATTESIPMDVLNFDEVQEMTLDQIEKTYERLSASAVRFMLMGSTANWPEADIHHWFLRGDRHSFHTECPTCGSKKPLDDYFPACIKYDPVIDRYRYVCPNGHWIDDSQVGEWIAARPEACGPIEYDVPKEFRRLRIRSIHFPQFLSPTISPDEILTAYNSATDMKNFFNRKLGKPYLDPSQIPVTLEHMAACVAAGKVAGIQWKSRARGTFMGIDQMGNFNVHVIKERLPDGRQAVIHVEETYSADPFERSSELMELYGVNVCVVEINPNYNDAKKFANRHPGRVFICDSFGSLAEDMIQWGDAPKLGTSDRRTNEEARDRYTLRMDQYKCMQVSMARFTADPPICLFPDPQGLIQTVREKGKEHDVPVLPRAFNHFTKTALVAEKDEETNKYRRVVKKVGIDPHFSYANMLCDVAWARAHGTTFFIFSDAQEESKVTEKPGAVVNSPIINIVRDQTEAMLANTCGGCIGFENGQCQQRFVRVQPTDPACDLYVDV